MPQVQLLDKTEIWVHGIQLDGAQLPSLALVMARALSLPEASVFVTDVRDGLVVFDVLLAEVPLEAVAGREVTVLSALAEVEGVHLQDGAAIHSRGVLGVIGAPKERVPDLLAEAQRLEINIERYTSRRVAIVSTGTELLDGRVRDTNLEAAKEMLGAAGFTVDSGGVVGDERQAIAGRVTRLADEGYGIVVTTGGVGAEDKDCTVEAFEMLDPKLATAVLARYTVGQGRHVKEAVRIGIARIGKSIAVALPGPTHEVRLALAALITGLEAGMPPEDLVEALAAPLRATLPQRHAAHH